MKNALKNWKTTLLGVLTIALSLLASHGKISANDAGAIAGGVGLILAKDSNVTGVGDNATVNN